MPRKTPRKELELSVLIFRNDGRLLRHWLLEVHNEHSSGYKSYHAVDGVNITGDLCAETLPGNLTGKPGFLARIRVVRIAEEKHPDLKESVADVPISGNCQDYVMDLFNRLVHDGVIDPGVDDGYTEAIQDLTTNYFGRSTDQWSD